MEENSPIAFISSSNCEHGSSGRALNSSSNSSGGPTGDVGGVLNGFDWIDDRDGVDEPFRGLECIGILVSFSDPAERGRSSAGDIGGVWVVCESCCRSAIDAASP